MNIKEEQRQKQTRTNLNIGCTLHRLTDCWNSGTLAIAPQLFHHGWEFLKEISCIRH